MSIKYAIWNNQPVQVTIIRSGTAGGKPMVLVRLADTGKIVGIEAEKLFDDLESAANQCIATMLDRLSTAFQPPESAGPPHEIGRQR